MSDTEQRTSRSKTWTPKPDDFKPEPVYGPDHKWAGTRRCSGWRGNLQRQCRKRARVGKEVCRLCGGNSLAGVASPSTETGLSSIYLSGVQKDDFKKFLDNPDLLYLTDAIAQVEAEVAECNRRSLVGESDDAWLELRNTYAEMIHCRDNDDAPGFATNMNKIGIILNINVGRARARIEKGQWLDRKGNLAEKERRIRLDTQRVISKERAFVWMQGLFFAMKIALDKHVGSQDARVLVLKEADNYFAQLSTD